MRKKHGLRPHEQRALEMAQKEQVPAAPPERGATTRSSRPQKQGKHGHKK